MNTNKFNADEATLSVDLSDARQAVKESRFKDALSLLEIILESQPDNIDGLYLAAVCSRYLKAFDESQKYIESLLALAPDMGRAYQELGHLNRDMGNEDKSVMHYRQACELNPALLAPWKILYDYFQKNNNQPAADHALQQINKLESLPASLLYIDQIMNEGRLGYCRNKVQSFSTKKILHTPMQCRF